MRHRGRRLGKALRIVGESSGSGKDLLVVGETA
jgi:hypothetical protein